MYNIFVFHVILNSISKGKSKRGKFLETFLFLFLFFVKSNVGLVFTAYKFLKLGERTDIHATVFIRSYLCCSHFV